MSKESLHSTFKRQKNRARNRGIPWKLEFSEWLQIWQASGHLAERGRCSWQYVMSRPGDQGAYECSNVRIVTALTNNMEREAVRRLKRAATPIPASSD